MQIGDMIREYRTAKKMTQEEMAQHLGVTAPAVNKWENGKTLPDIALLAPIARLLGTNIDTLLSFHETLTPEEITAYVQELEQLLKQSSYDESFAFGEALIRQYPNCDMLKWQIATVLEGHYILKQVSDKRYEQQLHGWLVSVLDSTDEQIRNHAADLLFAHHVRKGEYDKAEEMLTYYSEQNPERKRKQAELYSKSGNTEEAYKLYEELLFSHYHMCSMVFQSLSLLAMQENNVTDAHYYMDKHEALAKLFEMGRYHEISGKLNVISPEDKSTLEEIAKQLMECIDTITSFRNAPLYRHMTFREMDSDAMDEMKKELSSSLTEEGYL